jgi:hypothetical protein
MARAPRGTVPMTSGQGISRLSYQKAYSLGGGPPPVRGPGTLGTSSSFGKSSTPSMAAPQNSGIHVDYGATMDPGVSPRAVAAQPGFGGAPMRSSASLAPAAARPFAKQMPPIRLRRG